VGTRINLSPNPALKTTVSGPGTSWTSTPAGYARQTGLTGMDRTTGFGGTGAVDPITSPRFAAVAGQPYVASIQAKTGASNTFKVMINWYAGVSSGAFISGTPTTEFTVNGVARCEIGPFVAPPGAGAGYLRIIEVDNTAASFTAELVEQTSSTGRTYFDGDTPGASWAGTSGNSASYLLTASESWTWSDAASMVSVAPGPASADTIHWSESVSIAASSTHADFWTWSESAMVIALGYDERRGRVRVEAFGLPLSGVRAVVNSRPRGASRWAPVRGGKVALSGGRFARSVDDYEFAAGIATDYQIVAYASAEGALDQIVASAFGSLPAIDPQVWLKFIARPQLNRRVTLVGWDDVERSNRNSRFDVKGRSDPIMITDVHSSRSTAIRLRTETIEAGEQLDAALSSGIPAFLHTPVDLALPSMYVAIGDYSYSRPASYSHARTWNVDLTEVAPPPPSVFGPGVTCQSILDAYATCDEVLDAFATCADLMGG
jgi:hypothetical protein